MDCPGEPNELRLPGVRRGRPLRQARCSEYVYSTTLYLWILPCLIGGRKVVKLLATLKAMHSIVVNVFTRIRFWALKSSKRLNKGRLPIFRTQIFDLYALQTLHCRAYSITQPTLIVKSLLLWCYRSKKPALRRHIVHMCPIKSFYTHGSNLGQQTWLVYFHFRLQNDARGIWAASYYLIISLQLNSEKDGSAWSILENGLRVSGFEFYRVVWFIDYPPLMSLDIHADVIDKHFHFEVQSVEQLCADYSGLCLCVFRSADSTQAWTSSMYNWMT